MSHRTELEALRRRLDDLAASGDDGLTRRYRVRRRRPPPGLYWKLRWLAAHALRILEDAGMTRSDPWPPRLKHSAHLPRAKALLIWGVGTDRDMLREACRGFLEWQSAIPDFAPVLVTDVADFAFFSRLGWLVEYLPKLSGEGEPYDQRKAKFLARLYRGAPALPLAAGLASSAERKAIVEELLRWPRGRMRYSSVQAGPQGG